MMGTSQMMTPSGMVGSIPVKLIEITHFTANARSSLRFAVGRDSRKAFQLYYICLISPSFVFQYWNPKLLKVWHINHVND